MDRYSYALGMKAALDMKSDGIDEISIKDYNAAIRTVLSGNDPKFSEEEMKEILSELARLNSEKMRERMIEKAREWMIESSMIAGTSSFPSGLQYRVIHEGEGERPSDEDTVKCRLIGRLPDGRVIAGGKEILLIKLSKTFAGLREGIRMMRTGSKYELVIPYEMGFGENGFGNGVPPFSPMIFTVELLEIL